MYATATSTFFCSSALLLGADPVSLNDSELTHRYGAHDVRVSHTLAQAGTRGDQGGRKAHGAWRHRRHLSVDRYPVWLCYGTFTSFFTLCGVQLWTGLEKLRERPAELRSASRIVLVLSHCEHVAMLVEDHGETSACTFASQPPGPTECVCVCQCTHKYAPALQVVFDSAQVRGFAIRLHVTRR